MIFLDDPHGPNVIIQAIRRGSRRVRVRERFEDAAGFEDEGRGPEPQDAGEFKKQILLQSTQKEHNAADTLVLAQ